MEQKSNTVRCHKDMTSEEVKSVEDVPLLEGDILKATVEDIVKFYVEKYQPTRKTKRSRNYIFPKEQVKSLILKDVQSSLKDIGKVNF